MRTDVSRFIPGAVAPRVELVLRGPDGAPWTLTMSPGMERFVGHYPRLEGFDCGGPLLLYSSVVPH